MIFQKLKVYSLVIFSNIYIYIKGLLELTAIISNEEYYVEDIENHSQSEFSSSSSKSRKQLPTTIKILLSYLARYLKRGKKKYKSLKWNWSKSHLRRDVTGRGGVGLMWYE